MRRAVFFLGVLALCAGLTGCQPSKAAKEAREAGIASLDAGDYNAAIQSFEEALEERKGSVGEFEYDILKYRGEAEYRVGDYEAAAHTYDVLIQVDGGRAEYYNLYAMALARSGDWNSALEAYNKGLEADPEAAFGGEALSAVGEGCEGQGEYERAMTLYAQAIEAGGNAGRLYNRMGLCAMEKGDYEAALSYFDQGAAAGDAEALEDIRYNQAVAKEYMHDYEGALAAFEGYVSQYGSSPEAEHEIAFLRTR